MPPVVAAAGIGAAASLIGAGINAHSSSSAADKQAQAAEKALALQKETRDQQRQDRAGYLAAGNQALSYLGDYLGKQQNMALPSAFQNPYQTASASLGSFAQAQPMGTRPAVRPAPTGPQGPAQPMPGGPSSMVKMVAPTGERQMVPMSQVKHYQQLGAQVVG